MSRKILITGGARSGKSRQAVSLALEYPAPRVFVATADPNDQSMQERIARHRKERGEAFVTCEESLDLAAALHTLNNNPSVIVVDCVTVWVGNLLQQASETNRVKMMREFVTFVSETHLNLIMVTNEVGLAVVPANQIARDFVDELGSLNQELARGASEVIQMVVGIPQFLKGEKNAAGLVRTF